MCSYCSGRYKYQFPLIDNKEAVVDCLHMHAFANGPCSPRKLTEAINKSLHDIFAAGKSFNNEQSEGLILRMIACGIISLFFDVKNGTKSGKVLAKWSVIKTVNDNSPSQHQHQ